MKEIWKDIPGYEGLYQVSNFGKVKSLDRIIKRDCHGNYLCRGKVLSQHYNNKGRKYVLLSNRSKVNRYFVHRLVAVSFIPNPHYLSQINHIDGDPSNNNVDNLEWCNQSENELHKLYVLGRVNGSLLSPPRKIRRVEDGMVFQSLGDASRKTGLSVHILFYRLKTGKPDKSGNHWEYVV